MALQNGILNAATQTNAMVLEESIVACWTTLARLSPLHAAGVHPNERTERKDFK
jgi:hypothetical protein